MPRVIDNRNTLVASTPWVTGVKTGHTTNAGYVLVGSAKGRGGAKVISVVLGEPSEPARDADTLELLAWGLKQFKRVQVLDPRRALARADIRYYEDEQARLVPRRAAVSPSARGSGSGAGSGRARSSRGRCPPGRAPAP